MLLAKSGASTFVVEWPLTLARRSQVRQSSEGRSFDLSVDLDAYLASCRLVQDEVLARSER